MLQVLQSLNDGKTEVAEVPAPAIGAGNVLVKTDHTLISAGTEKMLVEFGQASWLRKAKSQPDKVKQVLDKIRTDGLLPTLDAVFTKLGEPIPLGYCNAGTVIAVGKDVSKFKPGDRVVSNGPHASFVSVPQNLCAKIPNDVSSEEAAFTVLASVGLQGVRLAEPTLGESVVVYGLGLVGLITVQLLRANGCHVIGVDINEKRLELAKSFGADVINGSQCDDIPSMVHTLTNNCGADAVVITASAKNNDIISVAAKSARKRGRIVLVGVVGLDIKRSDFYEKELTFQVSCSYGPGRYDASYEDNGHDYPLPFVRWTEQRNFEAILQMLDRSQISFKKLISNKFSINDAVSAYELIGKNKGALGVILEFPRDHSYEQTVTVTQKLAPSQSAKCDQITAAVIGAGNFTRATLMPSLKGVNIDVKYAVGRSSTSEIQHTAKKHSIEFATTDLSQALDDESVNLVLITTNHDSHSQLVCQSLRKQKHVFVEKPLALKLEQIADIQQEIASSPHSKVVVGFNRRFSPHTQKCKTLLQGRSSPIAVQILVNAGDIPANHWVHDPRVGGGRIIGEACHFIDLISFLANSPITSVGATMLGGSVDIREDKMSINLTLADGSIGNVCYFANGSKSYPKESIRIFSDNRVLDIENFRITRGYGFRGFSKLKTARQEKGHRPQFHALAKHLQGNGNNDFSFDSYINSTLASIAAMKSAEGNNVIELSKLGFELQQST